MNTKPITQIAVGDSIAYWRGRMTYSGTVTSIGPRGGLTVEFDALQYGPGTANGMAHTTHKVPRSQVIWVTNDWVNGLPHNPNTCPRK